MAYCGAKSPEVGLVGMSSHPGILLTSAIPSYQSSPPFLGKVHFRGDAGQDPLHLLQMDSFTVRKIRSGASRHRSIRTFWGNAPKPLLGWAKTFTLKEGLRRQKKGGGYDFS